MTKLPEFADLIDHFGSVPKAHRAVAKYALTGEIPNDSPSEWNWDDIHLHFNNPTTSLGIALAAFLKSRGIEW